MSTSFVLVPGISARSNLQQSSFPRGKAAGSVRIRPRRPRVFPSASAANAKTEDFDRRDTDDNRSTEGNNEEDASTKEANARNDSISAWIARTREGNARVNLSNSNVNDAKIRDPFSESNGPKSAARENGRNHRHNNAGRDIESFNGGIDAIAKSRRLKYQGRIDSSIFKPSMGYRRGQDTPGIHSESFGSSDNANDPFSNGSQVFQDSQILGSDHGDQVIDVTFAYDSEAHAHTHSVKEKRSSTRQQPNSSSAGIKPRDERLRDESHAGDEDQADDLGGDGLDSIAHVDDSVDDGFFSRYRSRKSEILDNEAAAASSNADIGFVGNSNDNDENLHANFRESFEEVEINRKEENDTHKNNNDYYDGSDEGSLAPDILHRSVRDVSSSGNIGQRYYSKETGPESGGDDQYPADRSTPKDHRRSNDNLSSGEFNEFDQNSGDPTLDQVDGAAQSERPRPFLHRADGDANAGSKDDSVTSREPENDIYDDRNRENYSHKTEMWRDSSNKKYTSRLDELFVKIVNFARFGDLVKLDAQHQVSDAADRTRVAERRDAESQSYSLNATSLQSRPTFTKGDEKSSADASPSSVALSSSVSGTDAGSDVAPSTEHDLEKPRIDEFKNSGADPRNVENDNELLLNGADAQNNADISPQDTNRIMEILSQWKSKQSGPDKQSSTRSKFRATRRAESRHRHVLDPPTAWNPMTEEDICSLQPEARARDRIFPDSDSLQDCSTCKGSGLKACPVCEGDGWVERPNGDVSSYQNLPYNVRAVWDRPDLVISAHGSAQCPPCNGIGRAFCDDCEGSGTTTRKGFDYDFEYDLVFGLDTGNLSDDDIDWDKYTIKDGLQNLNDDEEENGLDDFDRPIDVNVDGRRAVEVEDDLDEDEFEDEEAIRAIYEGRVDDVDIFDASYDTDDDNDDDEDEDDEDEEDEDDADDEDIDLAHDVDIDNVGSHVVDVNQPISNGFDVDVADEENILQIDSHELLNVNDDSSDGKVDPLDPDIDGIRLSRFDPEEIPEDDSNYAFDRGNDDHNGPRTMRNRNNRKKRDKGAQRPAFSDSVGDDELD